MMMAEYSLADSFGQSRVQAARIKMPDTEDLVPDTPTDAIGRYALVLLQWEELTRRQAKYEQELAQLQAAGDKLAAEWDALAAERQHCLGELGALDTPAHEVIERVWTLFKVQLFARCRMAQRGSSLSAAVPYQITTLAEPLTRNPRIL
jgi:hypothetical protein